MKKVTKNNTSIGAAIKYLREKNNMTQQELSEALTRKREEISMYENDTRTPNVETLISIAKYFDVSLDFLVGITDIESPNADLQIINKKLGLTENAIYTLTKFKNSKKILEQHYEDYEIDGVEKEEQKLDMLNSLLENTKFEQLLSYLFDYEKIDNEIKNHPTEMSFQRDEIKLLEDKKRSIECKIILIIFEIVNEK